MQQWTISNQDSFEIANKVQRLSKAVNFILTNVTYYVIIIRISGFNQRSE